MQQCIFDIFIHYRGSTEKALQFIMLLKSIYNKNFGFCEQNCSLTHLYSSYLDSVYNFR
jgi:hypothetical protein